MIGGSAVPAAAWWSRRGFRTGIEPDRNEAETAIGIEGTLLYLKAQTDPARMRFANLWTVGKIYDVMGEHGFNGEETPYGGRPSPEAKRMIEAYNRGEF